MLTTLASMPFATLNQACPIATLAHGHSVDEPLDQLANSVLHFDMQGSVAKSTRAGIPWRRCIRQEVSDVVRFWPFNGWDFPTGQSVSPTSNRRSFEGTIPQRAVPATSRTPGWSCGVWIDSMGATERRSRIQRFNNFGRPAAGHRRRVVNTAEKCTASHFGDPG